MVAPNNAVALVWYQANAILEWLESPANFKLITGGVSQSQVIAGFKLKKTDAYRELAKHVNERLGYTRPSEIWDANKAKFRFEAQLKKYKDLKKELSDVTGPKYCLTENELKSGMTLEMKRDKQFPQFKRWDILFGGRQNVSPSFTMEPGANLTPDSSIFSLAPRFQIQPVNDTEVVVLPDYEISGVVDQASIDPPVIAAEIPSATTSDLSADTAPHVEHQHIDMYFEEVDDQENVVNFIPHGQSVRSMLKKKSMSFEVDPACFS